MIPTERTPPGAEPTWGQMLPAVAAVAITFVVSPRHQFQVFRVPAAIMAASAVAVLWILGRIRSNDGRVGRIGGFTAALFVVVMVFLASYAVGVSRPLRFAQVEAADRDVLILFALCGWAMFVREIARTRGARVSLATALVVGAAASAVVAVAQQGLDLDFTEAIRIPSFVDEGLFSSGSRRLGFVRAHGTARHPIEFGTSMALALPFAIHFSTFGRSTRARAWARVAIVLLGAGIVLSLSRSAVVAVIALAVVIAPSWSPRRRRRALLFVMVVVGVAIAIQPSRIEAISDLATDLQGDEIAGVSIDARTADYDDVALLVQEHPVLGHGYGVHGGGTFATDNEYLDTAIETGVVGTVAFVAFLVIAFQCTGSARRDAEGRSDAAERDFAVALRASILAAIVCLGTFDGLSFPQFSVPLFLLLGLAAAMGDRPLTLRSRSMAGNYAPAMTA